LRERRKEFSQAVAHQAYSLEKSLNSSISLLPPACAFAMHNRKSLRRRKSRLNWSGDLQRGDVAIMSMTKSLNVLAVCAAFAFVAAIVIGAV
jgi:hypothetical protein